MQRSISRRQRLAICALGLAAAVFSFIGWWHSKRGLPADIATLIYNHGVANAMPSVAHLHDKTDNRSGENIPCIIHQSWKTAQLPSARARRWRQTWLSCMPGCKHILWTDEDNRKLIGMHYQWLLPLYECLKSGVQKADLARYVYMLHYGGIYTDIDTMCLRDFRHLLRPWNLVFGGMDGHWMRTVNGTYVQNSFMASEPGHPFWLGLLHRILLRHRKNLKGGAEESTGPLILMEQLEQYLKDNGQKDVKIFTPELFNPFSWITNRKKECKTHGGMNDEEEAACIASFPSAFVVQMHSKTWGGGRA